MSDDNKRNKLRVTVIAAALATLPVAQAYGAGLGKLTVLSGLGQPLRAELDISASKEELPTLTARIASPDSFRQANIEYSGLLSSLRFSLDKRPGGQPYFRISSDRAIGEPFLDLLVELNWSSGRLVREYTFLLDPPEVSKAPADVPAPVTAPVASTQPRREIDRPTPAVAERPTPKVSEKPAEKPAPAEKPSEKTAAKPAEKPTPRAAKPVAETPATRTVQKGDSLGKIAAEVRPEGVSLDQMLVALYRSNQEAFDGGNMNRLKAGKILTVPEKDAIAAVDTADARKIVLTHSADFDGYRRKLAGAVADSTPTKDDSKQSSAGKITAKVEDKAPQAAGKDKLQVSRADASGDGAKLKALEEDKAVREKALKDAQNRIAELEKSVADLRKLAEMKSQLAADLEKQAATKAALEAIKRPEPVKPAEAPKPAEAAKTVEAPKPEAAKPAEAPAQAKPEAPKVAAVEPAKPMPPVAKPPVAAPQAEPSFIDENGPLVYGGVGILALLAGYLGYNARRRKQAAAASAADSVLSTGSVLDDSSSQGLSQLDAQPSTFSGAAAGFGSGEGVDPVREADTFMAYGRDAQAEEILLDALAKTPENLHVHLKLLEIYAARKSVTQFNTVAQSLFAQTGGSGLEWERAVALGRVLDPSNSFYAADDAELASAIAADEAAQDSQSASTEAPLATEEPTPALAMEETAVLAPTAEAVAPELPDLSVAAPEPEPESGLAAVETPLAAPAEAPALAFEPSASEAVADVATEVATEAATELVEPAATNEEADALDLDFDLGAMTDVPAAAAQAEPAVPVAEPADAFASLDFDLNLDEPAPSAPAAVAEAAAPAADELLNIDFDLGDLAPPLAAPVAEAAPALEAPKAADANGLDFDLNLAGSEPPAPAAPALDVDFNLDLDAPAVPAAEANEVAPLDFNFDLGGDAATAATPELAAPAAPVVEEAATPLSLSDIDLELPTPAEAAADTPVATATLEAPAAEAEEDRPEVTTKLELAQAYEEMGDLEGAKELFQEVLAEGNSSQQAIAQEKLAKLG
ncbi:hypothetical protein DLREEDagrD3_05110 [Denitratisoma sp. agr-D3]